MVKHPNRLREWRQRLELTQPEAAERVGCSISQYKKLERGERGLGKWLKPAAKAFDVTPNDVLLPDNLVRDPAALINEGRRVEIAELDFKGGLGEGEVLVVEQPVAHWAAPAGYFGRLGDLIIIDTKGDSMQPTLVAGDRVVIDQSDKNPSQGGIFAIWDGYGVKVKRVETIAQSKPRRIRVLSENPVYPPDEIAVEDSTIVGRVVGLIRRFV